MFRFMLSQRVRLDLAQDLSRHEVSCGGEEQSLPVTCFKAVSKEMKERHEFCLVERARGEHKSRAN